MKEQGFAAVRVPSGEFQSRDLALPPGWDAFEEKESAHAAAEEERLNYVAVTRAAELLVLSVFTNAKGDVGKSYGWKPEIDQVLKGGLTGLSWPDLKAVETRTVIKIGAFDRTKARTDDAAAPSYEVKEISSLEAKADVVKGASRGPEFGTAMHAILQAMLDRDAEPTTELARNAFIEASERDPDAATVADLDREAADVAKSALWARMKAAGVRFTEVPMGLAGDCVYIGRADALFKDGEGWVLVDFKSDDPAGRKASLKTAYAPQLEKYAEIWKAVTGEPVTEKYLLFTRTAEAEKI